MKIRTFMLHGFQIEVWKFSKKQYYYPSFNGNAEFPVTTKGFKRLSSYLRFINFFNKRVWTI